MRRGKTFFFDSQNFCVNLGKLSHAIVQFHSDVASCESLRLPYGISPYRFSMVRYEVFSGKTGEKQPEMSIVKRVEGRGICQDP